MLNSNNRLVFLGLLFFVICGCAGKAEQTSIIPRPVSQKMLKGEFILNNNTRIIAGSDELVESATLMQDFISKKYGIRLELAENSRRNHIRLLISDTIDHEEGYFLRVRGTDVEIIGSTGAGVFWGMQTFFQLLPPGSGRVNRMAVPAVEIEDYPQFGWRGQHLDVGRHFYSVDFVKRFLDVMAMHKLNVFHWHLTEDQGWRVEIGKYPGLTEIAAWRDSTLIGSPLAYPPRYTGERYGGYYTRQEMEEVVEYARQRYITVLPEIELPGHTQAVLAAYPELSCTGGPHRPATTWGVFKEVFCAGKELTFEFLMDVFDEVLEIFPSEYIHIGGDEVPKDRWRECPDCQRRIREEGLGDEYELQSWFVSRIENYLHEKGRILIGWDEILEGGLPPRATVMSWRGMDGGIEAVKAGHKAIMTPWTPTYFYLYQGKYDEPVAGNDYAPLYDVYHHHPVPDGLNEEEAKLILGGQGCAWSEYMYTEELVDYMVFPRLTANAEVLWTERSLKDWDDFLRRMDDHYLRLDWYNINYRVDYPANYGFVNRFIEDVVHVELDNVIHTSDIRYTTDGTDPDGSSPLYQGPLTLNLTPGESLILKSRTIMPNGRKSAVHAGKFTRLDWEEPVTSSSGRPGLGYKYYEGRFLSPGEIAGEPAGTGILDRPELPSAARENYFAIVYEGYIDAPEKAVYDFSLSTGRGKGILYINEMNVVDNTAEIPRYYQNNGKIALEAGSHRIRLVYLSTSIRGHLRVGCTYNGNELNAIPASWFTH
jgi:hexosaminidase